MTYKLLHKLLGLFISVVFRCQVTGLHRIPAAGAVIIAANHISLLDPPVIGCSLPAARKVHFMAKIELFKIPVFGQIITALGAFPVRRGVSDRTAIRTALDILAQGKVIGIFPEGTRSKTGQLGRPAAGMAMLAVKSGAPVVPAMLLGTNKIFSRECFFPRIKIQFGEPVTLPPGCDGKEAAEYINTAVMNEIARMLKEAQR